MVKSDAVLLCLIKRLLYVRAATARIARMKTGRMIGATDGPRSWLQLTPAGHCDAIAGKFVDSNQLLGNCKYVKFSLSSVLHE